MRTGTISPLAWPFGSFGLPIFLAFGICLRLPDIACNGYLDGPVGRCGWRDMQDGHMPPGIAWIVRLVRPRIDAGSLRMILQIENLNLAFPDRLTVERLNHRHGFNVRGQSSRAACGSRLVVLRCSS